MNKSTFSHLLLILMLTLALLPWQGAQAQPSGQQLDSGFFYYVEGRPVSLSVSSGWVSVRFSSDDPQEQQQALSQAGLSLSLEQALQISHPRLTLIPLPESFAPQQAAQVAQALRSARQGVEFANPVFETSDAQMVLTDEMVATFPAAMSLEEIDALNAQQGLERVEEILGQPNTFVLRLAGGSKESALEAANRYQQEGFARYAAPDFVRLFKPQPSSPAERPLGGGGLAPNDPYYTDQWALENIRQYGTGMLADADIDAQLAWNTTTGNSSVIIAVIDEGVDLSHEDLAAKLVPGYDATSGGSGGGPWGNDAHGTNVAGLAAAVTNNGLGVAGVCRECRIMPVRIAYGAGGGWVTYDSWLANGIAWAYLSGASVLNNSWGGGSESTVINTAISNAKTYGRGGKGAVVLFAAGNDNASSVSYPGYLSTVIAVGASNMCDARKSPTYDLCNGYEDWWGSNYGSAVDISAPGVWLDSTDISGAAGYAGGNYFYSMNGTSGATPIVAGVAGLVLSVNPGLTAAQVQNILQSTADDIASPGWDIYTGFGRVNATRAVNLAAPYAPDYDFNGDKKADAVIFRASSNSWYLRNTGAIGVFGLATDTRAVADYNGDGKADVAVFRPSTANWYIKGMLSQVYGAVGDIPVPGDYNGDGIDNIAVFRPSNGTWYVQGLGATPYGANGDIPVPADYDGNGSDDFAVFRPSTGTWYIKGVGTVVYGANGDIPVPADYNGDGKAEVALFRPSTHTWYIRGVEIFPYGTNGDIPVPADYNGDGKVDVALYRPSNSTWYIRGMTAFVYGIAGDVPGR